MVSPQWFSPVPPSAKSGYVDVASGCLHKWIPALPKAFILLKPQLQEIDGHKNNLGKALASGQFNLNIASLLDFAFSGIDIWNIHSFIRYICLV